MNSQQKELLEQLVGSEPKFAGRVGISFMGAYLLILPILLVYLLVALWQPALSTQTGQVASGTEPDTLNASLQAETIADTPATLSTDADTAKSSKENPQIGRANRDDQAIPVVIFGRKMGDISPDVDLILLVMIVGALGSYVHAATSFVDYVGNRVFITSSTF